MNEEALKEEVFQATKVLKDGGVILYPTDTIWGIGCDARNEPAVQRIYQLKNRAEEKSMLILIDNENRLNRYVKSIPDAAWDLIEHSDKPLTIVFDDAIGVAPSIISADGSLGVRVVKEGFCHRMLHRFGNAVVSTSANVSGDPSPATFEQISAQIKAGKPSTIIKLTSDSRISILRK